MKVVTGNISRRVREAIRGGAVTLDQIVAACEIACVFDSGCGNGVDVLTHNNYE